MLETAPAAGAPDILIVDDDSDCLAEYVSLFDAAGLHSVTAQSATEGLRLLSAHPSVHVVLTDIGLPGVDGMTFLKLARSMHQGHQPPQAVVVTGQGSMSLAVDAMRGDAVDFLNKPATGGELLSAVARAGERWRANSRPRDLGSIVTRGPSASAVRPPSLSPEHDMLGLQLFARQARADFFHPDLTSDAPWDMLLHLTAARLSQREVCVASLVSASGTAATTAMRWLATLAERGLLMREPDKQDRRRIMVRLNDDALKAMTAYLRHVDAGRPQRGSLFSAAA